MDDRRSTGGTAPKYLYQITLRNLCAGVVTDAAGTITRAAPVFQWSAGKHITRLQDWVKEKKGFIQPVASEG